jgi:hypothetical protein
MDMQKAYTYTIWIYFIPLVFIGAFFLLNLTLAVINSKFTEAHNEHQQQELAEKERARMKKNEDDDEMDQVKDTMSIS